MVADKTGHIPPEQVNEYPLVGGPCDGQMVNTSDLTKIVYRTPDPQHPAFRARYVRKGYVFEYTYTEGKKNAVDG